MPDPIQLFDPETIRLNGMRRKPDSLFLLNEIADRVLDRLTDINRTFEKVAVIGFVPQPFRDAFPNLDAVPFNEESGDQEELLPGQIGFSNPPYDLILSVTGLHRVNDPVGALIQANRALKPDGLFLAALFAGDTLQELRRSLLVAETELSGRAAQRILPFGDVRDLGGLLQRADFALPVADLDHIDIEYRQFAKLLQDVRHMGEASCLAARPKTFAPKNLFAKAAEIYARDYQTADGTLKATFEIAYLSGWHPHESQQQPLKPGSGKVSMAEVLGKNAPKNPD